MVLISCWGSKLVSQSTYRLSASEASKVEKQLVDYLLRGFICARSFPWSSYILMAHKQHGSMCIGIDYHALNVLTFKKKESTPKDR